jgi:catechol 2,3-dioxygenase-like lactoylglutathione lyase family enzyme
MEDSAHPGGVLGPHAAALRAALLQPFLRLNFVTLWVRDQERSRRFFVEKLDFEAIVDLPTPDGGRWIVVAPLAAGWLPGTAGAGLPGFALVVPPEGSAEHHNEIRCNDTRQRLIVSVGATGPKNLGLPATVNLGIHTSSPD